jgi:hypothetical protein
VKKTTDLKVSETTYRDLEKVGGLVKKMAKRYKSLLEVRALFQIIDRQVSVAFCFELMDRQSPRRRKP